MRTIGTAAVLLACVLGGAQPASAQGTDRLWGRVTLTDGTTHTGFIRWDRNEAGVYDLLDGTREASEDAYLAWLDAVRDGERPVRTLDLLGYRISWNEQDPDFPGQSTSGVRFGHVRELRVIDRDRARLTLRSGQSVEFSGGASDIGIGLRETLVQGPDGTHEVEWDELRSVTFAAPPAGAAPTGRRLHGTVRDREGREFMGDLAWDLDEVLDLDVLDGADEDGTDHEIPFAEILRIEPLPGSARVVLRSGRSLQLAGTNDVGRGHRGVQISDPELGTVEVEWDDLASVDFHPPHDAATRPLLDGGVPLFGTVRTHHGDTLVGRIRWDADEEFTWELLDGRAGPVDFSIELGRVSRVVPDRIDGAHVTLRDGRTFHLTGSNDVTEDNKGVFVRADPDAGGVAKAEWRYVAWADLLDVTFHPPADRLTEEPRP